MIILLPEKNVSTKLNITKNQVKKILQSQSLKGRRHQVNTSDAGFLKIFNCPFSSIMVEAANSNGIGNKSLRTS
jgi:hypothetical protein